MRRHRTLFSSDNYPATPQVDDFAKTIIDYHYDHGRKQLPWQQPRTPYRVWVSEVMLQQTQVPRVIDYFTQFMDRFPTIAKLAEATNDEVMAAWSGLGYYARARNLHAAAKLMVERYNGEVPYDLAQLLALPGIGRSTAGAIRSSAFGIATPILDGNVKRVLSRVHAVQGRSGESATDKELWRLAELHTPTEDIETYTQGIMDFGANLCRKARPLCEQCPLASTCQAFARGITDEIPAPRKRKRQPLRRAYMLLMTDRAGRLFVERRPQSGLWGGLWSVPMRSIKEGYDDLADSPADNASQMPTFIHQFTHFALEIHPVRLTVDRFVRDQEDAARWVAPEECDALGMPAPTKRLIEQAFATTRQSARSDQADDAALA